jgi:hypothetical protein
MEKVAYISGYVGRFEIFLYPPSGSIKSFFFSDHVEYKEILEECGWIFVYLNLQVSEDLLENSVNSKRIKFLEFLKEEKYKSIFEKFDHILYSDHKFQITEEIVSKMVDKTPDGKLLIRLTPSKKNNIFEEIYDACKQDKYLQGIVETSKYINEMLDKNKSDIKVDICNTGVIFYKNYKNNEYMKLLETVYDCCVSMRQPECQIFWALHYPKYAEVIKIDNFDDIKIIYHRGLY